jgi:hypothetical protein
MHQIGGVSQNGAQQGGKIGTGCEDTRDLQQGFQLVLAVLGIKGKAHG